MSFTASMVTADGTITAYVNGKPYTISKGHMNYGQIVSAFKADDSDLFVGLTDTKAKIEEYLEVPDISGRYGWIELRHGVLYMQDKKLDDVIVERICDLIRQGYNFEHMMWFLNNLMANPSFHSVHQWYGFLSHDNPPN